MGDKPKFVSWKRAWANYTDTLVNGLNRQEIDAILEKEVNNYGKQVVSYQQHLEGIKLYLKEKQVNEHPLIKVIDNYING